MLARAGLETANVKHRNCASNNKLQKPLNGKLGNGNPHGRTPDQAVSLGLWLERSSTFWLC